MDHRELNHVAIHVEDLERSCAFYELVLELRPIPRPTFDLPRAWYRLEAVQELHLIGKRDQPVHAGTAGNHFVLMIDDMDAREAHAHLQKLGVEYYERRKRPDGALQIYVTDPDGHCIELCTAPVAAS